MFTKVSFKFLVINAVHCIGINFEHLINNNPCCLREGGKSLQALTCLQRLALKKDYTRTVLLIQLDGNLASDVSTRCSGRPPIP